MQSQRIYVAGPYSSDTEEGRVLNTNSAISYGIGLWKKGHVPFIPHLSHYVEKRIIETSFEREGWPYNEWMEWDHAWLRQCDAVYVIGHSHGVDLELETARRLGLTIYEHWDDVPVVIRPSFVSDLQETERFCEAADVPPRDCCFGAPVDQKFHALLDEIRDLHDRKMADYGSDEDPLANVRASEGFGIPGWVGAMVRGNDKMKRIQKFAKSKVLKNESVEDSLLDLAVYSLIALQLFREQPSG